MNTTCKSIILQLKKNFFKENKSKSVQYQVKKNANTKYGPEKIPQHASLPSSPIQTLRLSLFLVIHILYKKIDPDTISSQ